MPGMAVGWTAPVLGIPLLDATYPVLVAVSVLVAIVTHESPGRTIAHALDRLTGSPSLRGHPMLMHILD